MENTEHSIDKELMLYISHKKWRALIDRTTRICMLVVLMTEIVMFFVFKAGNLFLQPGPIFVFRFLIAPTLINFAILAVGWILKHTFAHSELVLNALPVLQLTLLCFMVSCVHHIFSVTFCTYMFAIFLSSIFGSKRLTGTVTILSLIFLSVAQLIGPSYNGYYSEYLIAEYGVAFIALIAAYLICSILVRFQDEKNSTIEEVYRSQVEAIRQLNLDQKTGLYGTTAFYNRLEQLINENPKKWPIAMAIFDIDNFKCVNDNFGHARGDEVIKGLAQIMKNICGERFFPIRFGGEEFIILFSGGEWQEYCDAAKRFAAEFANAHYDFTDKTISLSGGISQWMPGCTAEELFAQADKALYASKAAGKNQIAIYN